MSHFMQQLRDSSLLNRYLDWEALVMYRLNQANTIRGMRGFFALASRLGDGLGWYVLTALIVLFYGQPAWQPMGVMLLSGAVGVALYSAIKHGTARPRPHQAHQGLVLSVAPLDKYSFPSGHTLHAVNFGLQIIAFAPQLGWIVVPFSLAIALSRMVLGLHYLSDVLIGALIGLILAAGSLWLVGAWIG
ncbi:phosphatase PAP2 family protein [Halothiobacillus sp. DCM-1]|uniref:phosphatase PAP2 family protein n=1 Tax=Halothiobacillus sp. DCM-1 TaxID=3112558 RepID=UPI0032464972